MFGETTILYVMIWNHPIETTIKNWLFGDVWSSRYSTWHSNHHSTSYRKSVAINMLSLLGFHHEPAWGRLCEDKCPRGASLWPSCFPVRQAPNEMPVRLRQIFLERVVHEAWYGTNKIYVVWICTNKIEESKSGQYVTVCCLHTHSLIVCDIM